MMGYSWHTEHDPGLPAAEGLIWRWWPRRRAVHVDADTLTAAAANLHLWADTLEPHIRDGTGVCGDCAAALAELRRLASDMDTW